MFSDTTSIVANVGIMIVISALFIILFYRQYSGMQKMLGKYIESLESGKLAKPIVNEIAHEHDKGLESRLQITQKVNQTLAKSCLKIGAKRGIIFEFHNSAVNFTGLPFAKLSATFEYFEPDTRPFIQDYQNNAISPYAPVLYRLYQQELYVYEDTETPKENENYTIWIKQQRDAKACVVVGLRDTQNNIFGIIIFDFDHTLNKDDWKDGHVVDDLNKEVSRISGLLDLQHIY